MLHKIEPNIIDLSLALSALTDLVLIQNAWLDSNEINLEFPSRQTKERVAEKSTYRCKQTTSLESGSSAKLTCQVNFPVKWFKNHL